jgi:DNA-binding CsgD family transcriptional regulator
VSLTAVAPVEGAQGDAVFSSLTPREREILAHIVAGRTYAETARALVVSEKTVSVHVSNMLRKTGTANRVELAQLPGASPARHTVLSCHDLATPSSRRLRQGGLLGQEVPDGT